MFVEVRGRSAKLCLDQFKGYLHIIQTVSSLDKCLPAGEFDSCYCIGVLSLDSIYAFSRCGTWDFGICSEKSLGLEMFCKSIASVSTHHYSQRNISFLIVNTTQQTQ